MVLFHNCVEVSHIQLQRSRGDFRFSHVNFHLSQINFHISQARLQHPHNRFQLSRTRFQRSHIHFHFSQGDLHVSQIYLQNSQAVFHRSLGFRLYLSHFLKHCNSRFHILHISNNYRTFFVLLTQLTLAGMILNISQ